ncbi:peroxisomal membrane protein 11C isoform X2 [Mus caroli]|uniref:Peroxisomal membrane protein 11C isoform X2 n=1 Tax=Mus caroli TaxID=10089 RepID=A0A6P7R6N5_MUSCR|nr:peroxisomal membrane protein 11C isoform X2 [Mus caroli]
MTAGCLQAGVLPENFLPQLPELLGLQIRTLGYCCQLIGGVLVEQCPNRSEVGRRLLVVSAQFNHCRTVLRLFDDPAIFVYTKQYGLGTKEEDIFIRWLSVLSNVTDQLYYPCEHIAWAADAKVLRVDSAWWWTLNTALWTLSLLLGAVKALWTMLKLRQKLRSPTGTSASQLPRSKRRAMEARICSEVLTLLSNLADLANAVHWLPREKDLLVYVPHACLVPMEVGSPRTGVNIIWSHHGRET